MSNAYTVGICAWVLNYVISTVQRLRKLSRCYIIATKLILRERLTNSYIVKYLMANQKPKIKRYVRDVMHVMQYNLNCTVHCKGNQSGISIVPGLGFSREAGYARIGPVLVSF